MMCIISKTIYLSSVFSLVYPVASFASFNPAYASLVDTSQNQTFESRPANSIKLAAVHFITNDNALNFGNQEFLPGDLCKQGGYTYEGCPSGYIKGEACPYDSKFVKECIDPDTWCRNNGYNVTSCLVPKYLASPCPYKSTLYKSCETDNIRACKELGYSLTCDIGKVGDSAQTCAYNSSYKKCICNPCSGYDYTAAQASAQGYVPAEVCNSCGTMKYKRSENACSGYKTCDCGGETGAKVCYSGSVPQYDTCAKCCDNKFKYDTYNCSIKNGKYVSGDNCGDLFEQCLSVAQYLYGDGTVSYELKAEKTPIGIVFDATNRLAVALKNIWRAPVPYGDELVWSNSRFCSINIRSCGNGNGTFFNDDILTCAPDGKVNTNAVIAANCNGQVIPALLAYEPDGCTASFCRKGQWFIPSLRELVYMDYALKDIEKLLAQVDSDSLIISGGLWSSNIYSSSVYGFNFSTNGTSRPTVNNMVQEDSFGGSPKLRAVIHY